MDIQRSTELSCHSCVQEEEKQDVYNAQDKGLRDVSVYFEGTQEFTKQIVEEICDWKKMYVEEVIYFFYEILFLVLQHAVNLSLAIKTVV